MDKIEKIRKEIKRRRVFFEYNGETPDERAWRCLGELLAFIDSLEDEPTDYTNFTQKDSHSQGYDEAYLNDCIARAKKSWEGVDVDKYMDMVRGKEPVADDLEEEVKNYFQGYWPGTETAEQCNTDLHFTPLAIMRLARHFAEWQKEQMMKDAYEKPVKIDVFGHPYINEIELYDYNTDEPLAKEGDKVKVIVIKED